jgi:hypothetical protein
MTEQEALNSLELFIALVFFDKGRAWAFELRDEELHAVCVRYPEEEKDEVLEWIEKRMGVDTSSIPTFFLPSNRGRAVLVVKAPPVTDARQRYPMLVLHRPTRVLH